MDHAVIPAPARFETRGGPGFAFRPGTVVAYADTAVAPVAGRFCAQVARRTGLRLAPVRGGDPVSDEPSVRIELAAGAGLGGLSAPAGLSPGGGDPAGERYSLVIEDGRIVVRATEPVGVARGLTTLLQLAASAGQASAGQASAERPGRARSGCRPRESSTRRGTPGAACRSTWPVRSSPSRRSGG